MILPSDIYIFTINSKKKPISESLIQRITYYFSKYGNIYFI